MTEILVIEYMMYLILLLCLSCFGGLKFVFRPWSVLKYIRRVLRTTILKLCGIRLFYDPTRRRRAGPKGRAGPGPTRPRPWGPAWRFRVWSQEKLFLHVLKSVVPICWAYNKWPWMKKTVSQRFHVSQSWSWAYFCCLYYASADFLLIHMM